MCRFWKLLGFQSLKDCLPEHFTVTKKVESFNSLLCPYFLETFEQNHIKLLVGTPPKILYQFLGHKPSTFLNLHPLINSDHHRPFAFCPNLCRYIGRIVSYKENRTTTFDLSSSALVNVSYGTRRSRVCILASGADLNPSIVRPRRPPSITITNYTRDLLE